MAVSMSTSVSNVYDIMSGPGTAMKNVDSKRPMTVGPELERGVRETIQEQQKGTTENFKREVLTKINILV